MTRTRHGNANRLLIIDADELSAEKIAAAARSIGFEIAVVKELTELLERSEAFEPTALVLDIELPETDGIEILRMLAERKLQSEILLTGSGDRRVIAMTLELGKSRGLAMAGKLTKPIDPRELSVALAQLYRPEFAASAADIERALANREFVAYYQPKATLTGDGSWVVQSLEALARWQHPGVGLVMPDEFIPVAEDSGLMGPLTQAVLEQVLVDLAGWRDQGLDLACAVNLPPSLVTDLGFPDRISRIVAERDIEPGRLRFELTELATMQDATQMMDILTRLRVKGFGLSIDDFGTGYSSITRLYQMPFDEMKIDKSLVMNVPHSREANTIVSSLIELAHNLRLKVCAEGVENRAALDLLQVLKCDRCQGFYLSRAIPGADIPAFVASWNAQVAAGAGVAPAEAAV